MTLVDIDMIQFLKIGKDNKIRLPKKWVEENNLKRGDFIAVEFTHDKHLKIHAIKFGDKVE